LSSRASVLCAARVLGKARDVSRSLRNHQRAFGPLPFQIEPKPAFPRPCHPARNRGPRRARFWPGGVEAKDLLFTKTLCRPERSEGPASSQLLHPANSKSPSQKRLSSFFFHDPPNSTETLPIDFSHPGNLPLPFAILKVGDRWKRSRRPRLNRRDACRTNEPVGDRYRTSYRRRPRASGVSCVGVITPFD